MSLPSAFIAAHSLRAPLGTSSMQVAMAMRARKFEPRACAFIDKRERAIACGRMGGLPEDLHGYERLLSMAGAALRDLKPVLGSQPVPAVIALPEAEREDDDPAFVTHFVSDLRLRFGAPLHDHRSKVVRMGHAGGGRAFVEARAMLAKHPKVLVGGVDSYFHPEVLAGLDESCRLHALGAEDGFVPSEAAAFVLLSREGGPEVPRLVDAADAIDPSATGDTPDIGTAMTELLHGATEPRGLASWVLVDVFAERHRRRPWQMASLRQTLAEGATVTKLPEDLGDVGAASGVVAAAVAAALWEAGAGFDRTCFVALHAESGERALVVLEGPDRP